MSYIGSTPTTQSFIAGTDYFNGDGSTVAFTLSRSVVSVNDIEAVINNVEQQPNTAYTVSGTTITFTSAPSAGTGNIYVRYLSTTTQSITPSQGTVSYSTLNSDNQSKLGISFKNRIINGAMVVAQRGNVAVTQAAVAYGGADRFIGYPNYAGGGSATLAQTAVTWTNSGYAQGYTSASATGAGAVLFMQRIEAKNCIGLAGNFATLSLKIAHDYGSNCDVVVRISRPTTTADDFSSVTTVFGDTTIASVASGTSSGTSLVYTTPNSFTTSDVSKGLQINISIITAATYSSKNFYLGDVQLEVGTQATTFDYRSYGTELALCQRYYEKSYAIETAPGSNTSTGAIVNFGSTDSSGNIVTGRPFAVTKRTAPTMAYYRESGTAGSWDWGRSGATGNSAASNYYSGPTQYAVYVNSGVTWSASSATGHWTASAEL